MTSASQSSEDIKVIKASLELQQKVGTGTIEEYKVERAQKVIKENKVDFAPLARPQLEILMSAIKDAQSYTSGSGDDKAVLQTFMTPIMNIKANAATFNYPVISGLSGIVLTFLEDAKRYDKKAVQVVDLLYKTIQLVLIRKMSGEGGRDGKALQLAFQELCQKFAKKLAV
jgi:hypothetical protein